MEKHVDSMKRGHFTCGENPEELPPITPGQWEPIGLPHYPMGHVELPKIRGCEVCGGEMQECDEGIPKDVVVWVCLGCGHEMELDMRLEPPEFD